MHVNILNGLTKGEEKMSILFVSDLDGTLLRSDETTSDFTNKTINELVEKGMLFSYATARSFNTSQKVTKGLNAKIPLIVYNGAFIRDNVTGEILISNYFKDDVKNILDSLLEKDIYPIVYSFIDDEEKFSFVYNKCHQGAKDFIGTRKGDKRTNSIDNVLDLYKGNIFYITCIDEKEKLEPVYELYKDKYHCVFQEDIYTHEQWLEIMPLEASKSNAIKQLKQYLNCDRVVVFGDGKNDIDMFELADESYAVENAVEELKQIATAVIGTNNDDGVAKFLKDYVQKY